MYPRHSHAGTPCSPPEEAAATSRTVEAEDDGLNERDRSDTAPGLLISSEIF